jgi:serine/threonine protein kinase
MQPLVPGFAITGELSSSATGSMWTAVRHHDDRALVVRIVRVSDVTEALSLATHMTAVLHRIESEHLVRQYGAIALADGTLALVLDHVTGGSLALLLGARGHLTPGETVTTVAPLFGALADLHATGVVHGDLAPAKVLFSADGRPLVSDLGMARLMGRHVGPFDGTAGFVAPELVDGALPSPASDVYAMAAIGWFCLTGAPPVPSATRPSSTASSSTLPSSTLPSLPMPSSSMPSLTMPSLSTVTPETPSRLVEVLTSCLSTDPTARPSARSAAVAVFDAAPAESVALALLSDPAAEITRRIRAAAVSEPTLAPPSPMRRHRSAIVIGVVVLLVALALGAGLTWLRRSPSEAVQPVAVEPLTVRSVAQPSARSSTTTTTTTTTTASPVVRARTPPSITDVVTAPDSPRVAAAGLLQALVDARALAYVARNPALLDLVYSPGTTKARVDQSNIATALKNGATYLRLAFVAKDVAFLDATSDTARIRAIIVTPAYETGQPDGRKIAHAQEVVGPSVFTLSLGPDGWRILSVTAP